MPCLAPGHQQTPLTRLWLYCHLNMLHEPRCVTLVLATNQTMFMIACEVSNLSFELLFADSPSHSEKDQCVNCENPVITPTVCQKEDLMDNSIPDILIDVGTTKTDEYKSRNLGRIARCWLGGVKTFGCRVRAALVTVMLQLELWSHPMPTLCRPVVCSTIQNCSPSVLVPNCYRNMQQSNLARNILPLPSRWMSESKEIARNQRSSSLTICIIKWIHSRALSEYTSKFLEIIRIVFRA